MIRDKILKIKSLLIIGKDIPEYIRNKKIDWMGRHRKKEFCTLANSINVCNIMKLSKKGKPYKKFPKLMETHQTLFKTIPKL